MARERDAKGNPPRPNEPAPTPAPAPAPAPVLPGMVPPEPRLNPILPGPAEDYLHGVLMPAFLLMVFGACFIIHPMASKGHGSSAAVQDEALLAFCVFWLGTVSVLCRRLLVARLPAVANAPVYIVRFVQNCIFGPTPDP